MSDNENRLLERVQKFKAIGENVKLTCDSLAPKTGNLPISERFLRMFVCLVSRVLLRFVP